MDGGDLKTLHRQSGGIFGLLKMFGLGSADMQRQMSKPIKEQMAMQRGGFPWALAGLSMLPMLMGKGQDDVIRNQMKTTRDPIMQRGGLSVPPALMSKLPLLKQIGIPMAMGALASLGDKVVDKAFGEGRGSTRKPQRKKPMRLKPMRKKAKAPKRQLRRQFSAPRSQRRSPGATASRIKSVVHQNSGRVKRGAKRAARKALHDAGRRLFDRATKGNIRLESKPSELADTPFAQKLRESIRTTMSTAPTADSSHIGQTFNI